MSSNDSDRLPIHGAVPRFQSAGHLISESLRLFGKGFVPIVLISLTAFLPLELTRWFYPELVEPFEVSLWLLQVNLGRILLGTLVTPALIFALLPVVRGERSPSFVQAFGWGFRHWMRTLANFLAAYGIALVGLVLLVVPGLIAGAWFWLVGPVVAIEGSSQRRVLSRSRELVRGHTTMLVLAFLILVFLDIGVQIVLLQPLRFLLWSWLGIAGWGWFEPFSNLVRTVVGSLYDIAPLLAYLSFVGPDRDRIAEVFD